MVVNIDIAEHLHKLTDHFEELKTFYRVNIPFESFKQLLDDNDVRTAWCEAHCKDEFYSYHSIWYFKNKQDYLMFMLRWTK